VELPVNRNENQGIGVLEVPIVVATGRQGSAQSEHFKKAYFPGLNALRFFAAYLVLMHHSETIRRKYGLFNFESLSLFRNGSLAVSFFFVLSGFLITYLLMEEIARTKTVSIRGFYVRRILRIWPLYFFMVILGLFVVPFLLQMLHYDQALPYNPFTAFGMYFFFLSFLVNALYGSHLLEPLWSIGVEEYFYLIWAPLMKYSKGSVLRMIVSVLVLKNLLLVAMLWVGAEKYPVAYDVLGSLKFELMATGGLGAYWVFKDRAAVGGHFLFGKPFQVLFLTVLVMRLCFHFALVENGVQPYVALFNTPLVSQQLEGLLFLWLILNTSVNEKTILKLDKPVLNKLGEISYGLYVYQMVVIFGVILLGKKVLLHLSPGVATLGYYVVVSGALIAVSWFSKRYMEDWFLGMKKKWG